VIRLGLVGAGPVMQRMHLPSLRALADVELVTLADLQRDLAARVAAAFGIPDAYGDVTELLEAERDLDGLVVVTGRQWHAQGCLPARRRGISVFTERPLPASLADARPMVEPRASGARLMGYMKRYDPAVLEAARRLQAGDIGRVRYVRVHDRGRVLRGGRAGCGHPAAARRPEAEAGAARRGPGPSAFHPLAGAATPRRLGPVDRGLDPRRQPGPGPVRTDHGSPPVLGWRSKTGLGAHRHGDRSALGDGRTAPPGRGLGRNRSSPHGILFPTAEAAGFLLGDSCFTAAGFAAGTPQPEPSAPQAFSVSGELPATECTSALLRAGPFSPAQPPKRRFSSCTDRLGYRRSLAIFCTINAYASS
jgi:hypothetical protein